MWYDTVGLVKAFRGAEHNSLPGLLISTSDLFLLPVYSSRSSWTSSLLSYMPFYTHIRTLNIYVYTNETEIREKKRHQSPITLI